jgi:hypothetical protein
MAVAVHSAIRVWLHWFGGCPVTIDRARRAGFRVPPVSLGIGTGRRRHTRACAAALVLATALSGCSPSIIDAIPTSLGGLPEGVPERPAAQGAFPAVHDMPPPRADVKLSEAERQRLKQELIEQRARNEKAAAETTASTPSAGTPPPKP